MTFQERIQYLLQKYESVQTGIDDFGEVYA